MFPFLLQVPSPFQTDCMKNRQNEEELNKQLVSYFHGCSVNVQNMTIFVTNNSDVLCFKVPTFYLRYHGFVSERPI